MCVGCNVDVDQTIGSWIVSILHANSIATTFRVRYSYGTCFDKVCTHGGDKPFYNNATAYHLINSSTVDYKQMGNPASVQEGDSAFNFVGLRVLNWGLSENTTIG